MSSFFSKANAHLTTLKYYDKSWIGNNVYALLNTCYK